MPDLLNRIFRRRHDDDWLPCQELVELVSDYLEGTLSRRDTARFEAHIAECENCAAYVRQMRETLTLMGELPTDSLSAEAEEDLRVAFRGWKAGA